MAALIGTMASADRLCAQQAPLSGPLPNARQSEPLAKVQMVDISARPLAAFERAHAARREFGRLEFRGGLVLTARNASFGGWSGLVADDHGRLLAVSDRGHWMMADLVYSAGRPAGLENAVMGAIPGLEGRGQRGKDNDVESIALLEGTLSRGMVLVSFERNHRIGRFPIGPRGLEPPTGYLRMPTDLNRFVSANKGIEAVAVLQGGPLSGAIIAFAEEGFDSQRNHTGWLWVGGPAGEPAALNLTNIDDFAVTDVASLPDGALVVLERKFRWLDGIRMRLRYIPAGEIRPGARLDGEVLIEADMGFEIDNMEGLTISRDHRGQPLLTIISDNNFNDFLQRTVLLQFALGAETTARTR